MKLLTYYHGIYSRGSSIEDTENGDLYIYLSDADCAIADKDHGHLLDVVCDIATQLPYNGMRDEQNNYYLYSLTDHNSVFKIHSVDELYRMASHTGCIHLWETDESYEKRRAAFRRALRGC